MKVHYEPGAALTGLKNAVVTIGTFDGVHLGHRQIINQLKAVAAGIEGETVIITFHPHPRKIVSSVPGDVKLLTTLEERIGLLDAAGIDHLVVVPFDAKFAGQTAQQYIEDFLYKYFAPHSIIIGYDHRFGKGREGDYRMLEAYGKKLGFTVKEIPEQLNNEAAISSTRIRQSLIASDIHTANDLLGYPYFFEGTVIEGNKLGRTIGYPTANLRVGSEEKLIPGDAVYAVEAEVLNEGTKDNNDTVLLKGMMNIGNRPTVDGKKRVIEVNLFDFDKDIYGRTLRVHVRDYLRSEVKFTGLEALKAQLFRDSEMAKMKLANR